jgi:hypothetical protein
MASHHFANFNDFGDPDEGYPKKEWDPVKTIIWLAAFVTLFITLY